MEILKGYAKYWEKNMNYRFSLEKLIYRKTNYKMLAIKYSRLHSIDTNVGRGVFWTHIYKSYSLYVTNSLVFCTKFIEIEIFYGNISTRQTYLGPCNKFRGEIGAHCNNNLFYCTTDFWTKINQYIWKTQEYKLVSTNKKNQVFLISLSFYSIACTNSKKKLCNINESGKKNLMFIIVFFLFLIKNSLEESDRCLAREKKSLKFMKILYDFKILFLNQKIKWNWKFNKIIIKKDF